MNKLSLSALLAALALIASPTYAADVAAGKAIAEGGCADCHGDDGKGDDDNPAINGWAVDKFTKAMVEYGLMVAKLAADSGVERLLVVIVAKPESTAV